MQKLILLSWLTIIQAGTAISGPVPRPEHLSVAKDISMQSRNVPVPTTLATLIFGGVVSGLGLVGTKKLWENYNIIQMGAQHRPLPINLNPDVKNTPATTDDQAAVVNAFMRLAASAESHSGQKDSLTDEDIAYLGTLTETQKILMAEALALVPQYIKSADETQESTQSAENETGAAVSSKSSEGVKNLIKRATLWQASLAAIAGGIGFAMGGIGIQEWINRQFGPTSSYEKRFTSHVELD